MKLTSTDKHKNLYLEYADEILNFLSVISTTN